MCEVSPLESAFRAHTDDDAETAARAAAHEMHPHQRDAFQRSWEESALYAKESPPLSRIVVGAFRLNVVVLLAALVALPVSTDVERSTTWTRNLSVAAAGGALFVVALTYAVSSYYGHLPGFTDDDYRLSAAWDRPPATEIATVGLILALDCVPLVEWLRPEAGARTTRAVLAAAAVVALVNVAATPMSKMRIEHAQSTAFFFLCFLAYEIAVAVTVPHTLRDGYRAPSYAALACVAASLLYVVFGLKTWVRESQLFHLSTAEGSALFFILASIAIAGLGAPQSAASGSPLK